MFYKSINITIAKYLENVMNGKTGITSVDEVVRGFVSSTPITRGRAKNGRSWICLAVVCGTTILDEGIFPVYRDCSVHGEAADNLREVVKGNLIEVTGFIKVVPMRDKVGQIIKDPQGNIIKRELLISDKARHIPKEVYQRGRQLSLAKDISRPGPVPGPEYASCQELSTNKSDPSAPRDAGPGPGSELPVGGFAMM